MRTTCAFMLACSIFAPGLTIVYAQPPTPAPTPAPAPPASPTPDSSPAARAERVKHWLEDIDFLVKEFPAKHKNAFFHTSREDWEKRAETIRAKVPTASDAQLVVELRQLVALINDGHSNIWIDRESAVPAFHQYPFAVVWVADGLFVAALPKAHEAILGQKLVRIGTTPIAEVIERVATLRASDNESGKRNSVPADMRDSESLVALGILSKPDAAAFTFADSAGVETTITLDPITSATTGLTFAQKPDPQTLPIGRRPRRPAFGFELLTDRKTFYIWYDTCSDQKDKTVAQFIEETMQAFDGEMAKKPSSVERVVIDFRRNGGGNSALFMPMIDAFARRDAINQKGKLVGLIGRGTFSSGMMNAHQLRAATKAILVGQPTGGSPNHYGEVRQFRLPHSKLAVQYSTKLFRLVNDEVDSVYPDIPVEPDSAAFFSSRDLVLDAAINAGSINAK